MKKTSLILAVALSAVATTSAQKAAPTNTGLYPGANASHAGQTIVPGNIISQNTFNGVTETAVSVAGEQSWDLQGDPSNTVLSIDLGAGNEVTGIGWDVDCTTVGGSWLSEAQFFFTDSGGGQGIFLTPSATAGPGAEANSSPVLVLADLGIPNIVMADGILLIELDETFDDVSDAVDADWGGSLTVQHTGMAGGVPTVGQWGLITLTTLLFAGVVVRSVRSRKS